MSPPAHAPPSAPLSRHDQQAQIQANIAATVLVMQRGATDTPTARFEFLNTLDRVDDPAVRDRMMAKFEQMTGQPLDTFITQAEWGGIRDKDQALELISPRRGAAEKELAKQSPAQRKQLRAKASGWAEDILKVTTTNDADDDDQAQKVTRVLGGRTPAEIEAIRAEIRNNTHQDHSLYEQLDRSLSGGNENEAVADLHGDPVTAASVGLINAAGKPARIQELLRGLIPSSSPS